MGGVGLIPVTPNVQDLVSPPFTGAGTSTMFINTSLVTVLKEMQSQWLVLDVWAVDRVHFGFTIRHASQC